MQPTLYDGPPHAEGTPEDPARDGITLPLIRAAVARGVPLLAICRGFQELNVALGGSLHQRLQDLPDRMDHSTPMQPSSRVRQGKAHAIRVTPGGWLHRLAGAAEIAVNSLHNQGIDRLAPGLVAEGVAPDGTIEAVRVVASQAGPAIGYAVGVQWHPEYDWRTDPLSTRHLRAVRRRRPRLCRGRTPRRSIPRRRLDPNALAQAPPQARKSRPHPIFPLARSGVGPISRRDRTRTVRIASPVSRPDRTVRICFPQYFAFTSIRTGHRHVH